MDAPVRVAPAEEAGAIDRVLGAVEARLPGYVRECRLFTGERSEANLRLYRRHGYRETHRTDTPAGYSLVHMSKLREGSSALPGRR